MDYMGTSNRLLNSLPSGNVPLHKTLNYFGPKVYKKEGIMDILTSANSDFILTGLDNGECHLNLGSLRLQIRKIINMFATPDVKNRQKLQKKVLEKLETRLKFFDDYDRGITKKGQPLAILQGGKAPAAD